jgi:hypothetical protein
VICSALKEWIAGIFAMRANTLEAGIRNLLGDADGGATTRQLYSHPLIKTLTRKGWLDKLLKRTNRPSYIPARAFALALMDIIAPPGPAPAPKALKDVRDKVSNLPDADMKKVLLALVDDAQGDLTRARKNIEDWFNDAMDRVSGWYKRKAQVIILVLALLTTVFLNADTLTIANSLWRDTTIRASIVAAAEQAVKQSPPAGQEAPLPRIRQLQTQLQELQLPIGWSPIAGASQVPGAAYGWLMKFAGLFLTTIAVSLGAPFWFDLLNRLINLRSVGNPPEKTP